MSRPPWRGERGGRGGYPGWRETPASGTFTDSLTAQITSLAADEVEYLPESQYRPPVACLALELRLGDAVIQLAGDAAARDKHLDGALRAQLFAAALRQHSQLLVGPHSVPSRHAWAGLQRVLFALQPTDAASQELSGVLQNQALVVDVEGQPVRLPARAVTARLPPNHCEVTVQGLAPHFARRGATEALLLAAGYSLEGGYSVVHERRGLAVGPGGELLPGGRLDMLVAVVSTPPTDRALSRLPRVVRGLGWDATVHVAPSISTPKALVWARPPVLAAGRPAALAAAEPPHPASRTAVLQRVGEAHGLTAAVLAAACPPIAEAAVRTALPPHSRSGLGFAAMQPASPRQPLPPPELSMPDAAPPPPPPPLDEPVFGAALAWVQDETDLSPEEAGAVVHAVRQQQPQAYAACRGAGRASELPVGLRAAIYSQAAQLVGEERAGSLQPAPAGGGPGEASTTAACLPDCLPSEVGGTERAGEGVGPTPAVMPEGRRRSPRTPQPAIQADGTPTWLGPSQHSVAPHRPPSGGGGGGGRRRL